MAASQIRRFASIVMANGFLANGKTNGIGYKTKSAVGGAVTQITSRATGVTLDKLTGTITTDPTSLAAAAEISFVVTNAKVAATDIPVLAIKSGSTTPGGTWVAVTAVAAGSFTITLTNLTAATADVAALVINYAIIKGAAD